MSARKGFTLIEIIVVLIILGTLAAISVGYYNTLILQGATTAARNNLITIYQAQQTYYFNNHKYCHAAGGYCNSLTTINTNLSLNITDNYFTYKCKVDPSGFVCSATYIPDSFFGMNIKNNPIILPGGTNCLGQSNQELAPCNPECLSNILSCPTS